MNTIVSFALLFPLRTHVPSEARILAHRITAMSYQIFAVATEKTMPIAPETAEHFLTTLVRLRIEMSELAREIAPRRSADAALLEAASYRKTHGVYWTGLDFHALQRTFRHRLMDNRAPGYVKCRLMGHSAPDEGENAQGGISMKTLHDEIAAISFDLSRVVSPFGAEVRVEETGLRLVGWREAPDRAPESSPRCASFERPRSRKSRRRTAGLVEHG